MNLSKNAGLVLNKLIAAGYEAYVVGGAVRSHLLGLPVTDYDFTTSATPDEVLSVFFSYNTLTYGIKHGTVCVVIDGEKFEITTFRTENKYFDSRHPSSVSFVGSLTDDLMRRDFTVNAMCFDGDKIIDLHGGMNDCNACLIRAIGNPSDRFDEDALRILRALRFASKLNFDIEPDTKKAVFVRKRLLNNISSERIREEFNGLLMGSGCYSVLKEFRSVIAEFIPEIEATFDFDQRSIHHAYDVYEHSIRACALVEPRLELRLAAFLHDIGKPSCFTVDEDGRGHFYGHAKASRKIAEAVLDRLKYSNSEKEEVLTLIEHHDYPIVPNEYEVEDKYVLRSLRKFGKDTVYNLLSLKRADNLAKGKDVTGRIETITLIKSSLDRILSSSPCFTLKNLAVNGRDLIELGYKGKGVGQSLELLLNAVVDGKVENQREQLLAYLSERGGD